MEVEYFIALCELGISPLDKVDSSVFDLLRKVADDFSEQDALRIKVIEKITNHDVKAVEYFLKEKFDELDLEAFKEFIHFGLTSQDINNTATPMMWKAALEKSYVPQLEELASLLAGFAEEWKEIPMLARTHGQPASPTRLGKEIRVFEYRLRNQIEVLKHIPAKAKFGGATGNFNAHRVPIPVLTGKALRRVSYRTSWGWSVRSIPPRYRTMTHWQPPSMP